MLPMLVWTLNHYADFRWFAAYDKGVEAASFIVLLIAVCFVGPTVAEIEERRAKRNRDRELNR